MDLGPTRSRPRVVGLVVEVWNLEGYGYAEVEGGQRVFFDRRSVAPGHFARLIVGSEVSFERELPAEASELVARALRLRVVRNPERRLQRPTGPPR